MMVPGAKANDIDAAGREIMMKNSFGLSMAALLGRHGEGWPLCARQHKRTSLIINISI